MEVARGADLGMCAVNIGQDGGKSMALIWEVNILIVKFGHSDHEPFHGLLKNDCSIVDFIRRVVDCKATLRSSRRMLHKTESNTGICLCWGGSLVCITMVAVHDLMR